MDSGNIHTYKIALKLDVSRDFRIQIEFASQRNRVPNFGDFVTILIEGSMQDVTVARLRSTRVKTPLSPLY
jgi:hypothetical protein